MNIDGTGRTLVAENAHDPCWGPDSEEIAYLPEEPVPTIDGGYVTKGFSIYNLNTGETRERPNKELLHLYYLTW